MHDDRRFARICAWLKQHGMCLRCLNTARSAKQKPILILVDKKTKREVARG